MRKTQVGQKGLQHSWHALPTGEDPFRQLLDSVRDYAIYLLDHQGIIRSWNIGAELIKGFRADEIIGQPFAALHAPAEVERGRPQDLLAAAAANRSEEHTSELQSRRDIVCRLLLEKKKITNT